MRFLFINQYYAPDYAATAQMLRDFCEDLVERGHEVHVLAGAALYDGRELLLPTREKINGVHVHRVRMSQIRRGRIRERFWGYLNFYIKAFLRANTLPRADVVVTLTTPPMISLLGAWLRLTRRSQFVFWVMDVYPDIALRAGVIKPLGPVRTIWSLLGRISYHSANRVVVLGRCMADVIARKGIRRDKIDVITCWASREEIYTVDNGKNQFRGEYIDPDTFSVMYSGNMGVCHCFESVIEGVSSIDRSEGIRFLFVGGGKQQAYLAENLDQPDGVTRFLPYRDRAELAESLSAPDVHLITLHPRYDGLLVPSKIYGIMAAGRGIIFVGSHENEIAHIIKAARCGIVVNPDDAAAFAETVRWMARNRDEVAEMGRRGREYFERYFERRIVSEQFARILEDTGAVSDLAGKTIAGRREEIVPLSSPSSSSERLKPAPSNSLE